MRTPRQRRREQTTALNIEARFDAGEDVLDYFDTSRAVRGDLPPQSVRVSLPACVMSALDTEADRRGVPRQSLLKFAVVEWLEAQEKRPRPAQGRMPARSSA